MYMRTIIFFLSALLLVMATTVSATPNPIYKQAKIRRHDGGEGGGSSDQWGSGSGSSWGNTGGDGGSSWGNGGGDSGSGWGGSGGYPKPSKQ